MVFKPFYLKTILILLSITLGVIFFSCRPKGVYRVSTFKTESGFGYQIEGREKVIIHQPTIPGVAGNQSFRTNQDAFKTGSLVLEKLKDKKYPAISTRELDSLQVDYSGSNREE